ncbi:MAG: sodium-dependent transporter [Lentisphaeria bacterium]|nr:sodium-dependent transporter [Lentisphaeria bacterium]
MSENSRENWGSKVGFILSIAGSAIGLGNIWRFPYIAGVNGGAAFLMVYLACVFLVGLPIMICELSIGRASQKDAVGAFGKLFPGRSALANAIGFLLLCYGAFLAFHTSIGLGILMAVAGALMLKFGFKVTGALSLLVAMLILSYYSVIGGWILEYVRVSFTPGFSTLNTVSAAETEFGNFLGSPILIVILHLSFLGLSAAMLWGGIKDGIERWSKVLLPVLFLLLVVVIVRSVTLEGASTGLSFLFHPDFSKLNTKCFMDALGHSFYSLSLGMAISITYGSYQSKKDNLYSSALSVIILDTMGAILAGLAIFPAVFAMGLNPAAGPGLIFQVLPATFNKIPLGWLWSGCFFLMLAIAALTSAASLMECGVTFLLDHTRLKRHAAIVITYLVTGLVGILSCVSISNWDNIEWLHKGLTACFGEAAIAGNWFDFLDMLCSNWILPASGMLTALFAGWVWTARKATAELRQGAEKMADRSILLWLAGLSDGSDSQNEKASTTLSVVWSIVIRIIAPLAIFFIFLNVTGLI